MEPKPKETEEWVDPYPKKKSKVGWLTTAIILLVIYVLSTGPAFVLDQKGCLPTGAIETIYAPLGALSHACPPVERFMRWYIRDVWQIKPKRMIYTSP